MSSVVRLQSQHETVLDLIQHRYPNYHPIVAMVDLVHRDDVFQKDPKLEFEIHKAIAPYVAPRLSSMEITPPREPGRVIVSLFDQKTLEDGSTVEVEIPLITEVGEVVPLDAD